ncbi:hypothetical protein LCGC14_1917310 [marine sediment metagenome]|uniref:Uncharacterized protein n=1 Tax=marine sediment metagenome TaxID=412755 RepID=A0A0F9GF42_9ZZZZ
MIGLAYPAFYDHFKYHYPKLVRIEAIEDIEKCNLIIFPGGADINPKIYGELNRHSYCNLYRDKVELKVLKTALKLNKKILGVCRGHQLVNAYLGARMVQDMYEDLGPNSHGGIHKLEFLTNNSIIERFFNITNSIHHQGIITSGKGLTPTSKFKKVIESVESENIITVQFHPEMMGRDGDEFFAFIKKWSIQ